MFRMFWQISLKVAHAGFSVLAKFTFSTFQLLMFDWNNAAGFLRFPLSNWTNWLDAPTLTDFSCSTIAVIFLYLIQHDPYSLKSLVIWIIYGTLWTGIHLTVFTQLLFGFSCKYDLAVYYIAFLGVETMFDGFSPETESIFFKYSFSLCAN